ncbi:hypothetical protein RND81_07G034300 [Saponaria officinalis]|uniref:RING-CH-type domain-containing protein n=1 Tax=Saponaria officinalis TaxID=3572 RepID=A0AAW1JNB2_SAPOF
MGDHLALVVNRLLTEATLHAAIESRNWSKEVVDDQEDVEYLQPKMDFKDVSYPRKLVECRICQDEDLDSNMETPCSCCGSLKYAHRRCVQRWCNEKGDTVCEICHQKFEPGYRAPPPLLKYGRIPVNFRRNWQINRRELTEPQLPTVSSDHALLNSDFEEPSSRNLIFRIAVAIIFIGLLILRHTLPIMVGGSEFVLPLMILAALRIAGILLLVYVTMMAVTGLRRQRNQHVVEESAPTILVISSDEETEQLDQQPEQDSHVIQIP